MNKEEKHLLKIMFMYEYYKDDITKIYLKNLSDNIVLDNSCLDIEDLEKIYVIPFKKYQQLQYRINKAVEFIENNIPNLSNAEVYDLLEILKGDNNEC